MKTTLSSNNWEQTKGMIKAKWNHLSDDSVELVKENLHQLSDSIQHAYGYAKEKADQELTTFMETVRSAVGQKAPTKVEKTSASVKKIAKKVKRSVTPKRK